MEISELRADTQKEFGGLIKFYLAYLVNPPVGLEQAITYCVHQIREAKLFDNEQIPEMAMLGVSIMTARVYLDVQEKKIVDFEALVREVAHFIKRVYPMRIWFITVPTWLYCLSMNFAYDLYAPKLFHELRKSSK